MGAACLPAQTPCGDLRLPPSRTNMSFFAIIELVVFKKLLFCLLNKFENITLFPLDVTDLNQIND